jgi:DNA (cytosine-5)-methyltransferase 1
VSWDFKESGETREETSANVENGVDGHNNNLTGNVVNTLRGGRVDKDNIGLVILNDQGGTNLNVETSDIAPCLRSETHGNLPIVYDARGNGDGKTVNTLTGDHENRITDYTSIALDCRNHKINKTSTPLQAKPNGGQSLNYIKDPTDLIVNNYKARRLTPLECERLQGFPDGWTEYGHDNKKISDSTRYRALGNSVAIPCVLRVLEGIRNAG